MPVHQPLLPRVIVKFRDSVTLPYADDIGDIIQSRDVGSWMSLEQTFRGISIRRLARSSDGERISQLVEQAVRADPTYKGRNLLAYFVVECPANVEPEHVAEQLSHWPLVEAAFVAESPSSPQCTVGYEDPPDVFSATGGIDAIYAHTVNGGDGAGQSFIDIELGWTREHIALSSLGLPPQPLTGDIEDPSRPHGTAVLGIVCGSAPGFVGIAPGVSYVNIASYLPVNGSVADETLLPDAILAAINDTSMGFGSVLLLEVQTGAEKLPIETRLECFDFIRLATALGIVVVEAAGNASRDLDLYENPPLSGTRPLWRDPSNQAAFKDSGAILVGAGSQTRLAAVVGSGTSPPPPAHFGNFGSRVDCWAWGDNSPLSSFSTAANDTTDFKCFPGPGTSSASAIIPGAALSVQGMLQASTSPPRRYSPAQLRAVLSDPANGTQAIGLDGDKIGMMANLRKIATAVINATPDVYLRDYVGDPGQPNGGAFCTSPDIILRNSPVANPLASFLGAGLDDNDMLRDPRHSSVGRYVYLRCAIVAEAMQATSTSTSISRRLSLVLPAHGRCSAEPPLPAYDGRCVTGEWTDHLATQ